MASFPASFSARPNLSTRLSPSQIHHHLAPSILSCPLPPSPPPPEPPPVLFPPPIPLPCNPNSVSGPPSKKWSTLFESKPRNAGSFSPPPLKLVFKDGALQPTVQILEAADEQWRGYLIGHFLDRPLPYSVVSYRLKKLWKPTGGIQIKSTGSVFFFYFECVEDRERILQADPVIIHDKLFIVRPWMSNLGDLNKSINSVPVWIKLSNLPLNCLSKIGICYLAMRIGKFLCMDLITEKLERLEYAKCMVEISPHDELPYNFPVLLPDGSEQIVHVTYLWRPAICVKCVSFGHTSNNCVKYKVESAKGTSTSDKVRTLAITNAERVKSNTFVRNDVSTLCSNSEWMRVTGKKKEVSVKNPKMNKNKKEVSTGEGVASNSRFAVLSTVQEEDSVLDEDNVSEEGEIRQVSELLSRAFPSHVGSTENPSALVKACSGQLDEIAVDEHEVQRQKENKEGSFDEHDVDQDSRIIRDGKNLDSFLQSNFDCVENCSKVNKKKMKTKDKAKYKVEGKGVRESIEELRAEIKSGILDHFLYEEKLKLMDTMIYNYNSMEVYAAERDRMGLIQNEMNVCKPSSSGLKPGFLNLCVDISSSKPACTVKSSSPLSANKESEKSKRNPGPYDQIQPPPGFKAPPESSFNPPTIVLSSAISTGSNHITRSKKIELLKGPNDDKG